MSNLIAGTIAFKVDGTQLLAKGNFSWNLGHAKREAVMGSDGFHGYKETPQVPYIEGEITIDADTDVTGILDTVDATVTLDLATGNSIVLSGGYYAGDGKGETEEGKLTIRFEGSSAEEV
jgi:hypothetical protein